VSGKKADEERTLATEAAQEVHIVERAGEALPGTEPPLAPLAVTPSHGHVTGNEVETRNGVAYLVPGGFLNSPLDTPLQGNPSLETKSG